jgi:hypothetical protein
LSHSKLDRRPLEERFERFKKWIVRCTACGRQGRAPWFETRYPDVPGASGENLRRLVTRFEEACPEMELDELGRCQECSAAVAP